MIENHEDCQTIKCNGVLENTKPQPNPQMTTEALDAELFAKLQPNNIVTFCIDSRSAHDIRLTFSVVKNDNQ